MLKPAFLLSLILALLSGGIHNDGLDDPDSVQHLEGTRIDFEDFFTPVDTTILGGTEEAYLFSFIQASMLRTR